VRPQKNTITGEEEQFYLPSEEQVVDKSFNYGRSHRPFLKLGTQVKANDVVIAKYMPNRERKNEMRVTRSRPTNTESSTRSSPTRRKQYGQWWYSFCKLRLANIEPP
jgi:hypothetical protein